MEKSWMTCRTCMRNRKKREEIRAQEEGNMTVLIELKEKLKEFYGSCSGIVLPIVKFLLALAVFRGINSNLGYLKMLNSMYVVLILSLICAILPLNGMVFLAMLVIIGHCFALHMVIAGLAALVLLVLWFLYLRFVPKDAPALLLTPLAFWLHVPSAVPVAYGLAGTPLSAFSAACGVVVYYMCDMIHGKMERCFMRRKHRRSRQSYRNFQRPLPQ